MSWGWGGPRDGCPRGATKRLAAFGRVGLGAVLAGLSGCSDVSAAPDVPGSIEMDALPSPSVVIGDTLRTIDGVVAPVKAIVRNVAGTVILDAPVRYLYADYPRDSALLVDSVSGLVRAVKVARGDARLAARVSGTLQVILPVVVTTRPDSADRTGQPALSLFTTTLPDTGKSGATANSSPALTVVVRHVETPGASSTVTAWPVRYELLSPANPNNDTTKVAWLVDDAGRASVLDTTDASGVAGRKVRIRAANFPAAGVTDSIVVRATVTYRGLAVRGAPIRLVFPVKRGN